MAQSAAPTSAESVIHFREFQKTFWHLKHLPYYDELSCDADRQFIDIKSGLLNAVVARDMRTAFVYYLTELNKYMDVHSLRFTKADHIDLVKLIYSCFVDKHFPHDIIKFCAHTLLVLLSRDHLLHPSELVIEWRPLYDLYVEHFCGKGDRLPKESLLSQFLESVINSCRPYFALEATREILDEVRPWMHPFDESMARALRILAIFLPTKLSKFEHDTYGAKLWFDEAWHWFCSDTEGDWESFLIHLFARLTAECCGYIAWNAKLDIIFARIMRSLDLTVQKRGRPTKRQSTLQPPAQLQLTACWIVYMLGGKDDCAQPYLTRMVNALESYFHPSNTGYHTGRLLIFLGSVCSTFVFRIHQERYCKRGAPEISAEMRISDRQIEVFVESILPCIEWTIFSKTENSITPAILRNLAFLTPGLVLPPILDLVYSALSVTNEPHRLLQSMNCLVAVMIPLIRDNELVGKRRPLRASVQEILEKQRIAREDAVEAKLIQNHELSKNQRKEWKKRYFERHSRSPFPNPLSPMGSNICQGLSSSQVSDSSEECSERPTTKNGSPVNAIKRNNPVQVTTQASINNNNDKAEGKKPTWTSSVAKLLQNLSTSTAKPIPTVAASKSGSSISSTSTAAVPSSSTASTVSTSTSKTDLDEELPPISPSKYSSVNLKYSTVNVSAVGTLGEQTRKFLQAPLRGHVITLLEVLIPSLDINDIYKTTLAFESIQRLFSLIAIVDCSSALEQRTDLTLEEMELCTATQRLPDIVDNFVTKIFDLILALSTTMPFSSSHSLSSIADNDGGPKFGAEEVLLKKYMTCAYCALLNNCSTEIQNSVTDRLLEFVADNMLDNILGASIVSDLIFQTVYNSPERAFPLFLSYVMEKLPPLLTDQIREQRELDTATLWFISLASSIFIVPGNYIVKYKEECLHLYKLLLSLKCPSAYQMGCNSILCAIGSLVNTFVEDDRGKQAMLSQPMTDYLPIRHWAKKVSKDQIILSWHVPSEEEVELAKEFVNLFIIKELDRLSKPNMLKKAEIYMSLVKINSVFVGASELLPPLSGEQLIPEDTAVELRPIYYAKTTHEIDFEGRNIRTVIAESMHELITNLLATREEDTKSLSIICALLNHLVFSRTVSPFNYNYQLMDFAQTTCAFGDPVRGKKASIQELLNVGITLAHRQRSLVSQVMRAGFNSTHFLIIKDLIRMVMSPYENVRNSATIALGNMLSSYPQAAPLVAEHIITYLKSKDDEPLSEDAVKGVLTLVSSGQLFDANNWKVISILLPSLVEAKYPENADMVSLLRYVEAASVFGWKDTAITIEVPDTLVDLAKDIIDRSQKKIASEYKYKFLTSKEQMESVEREKLKNQQIMKVYDDLLSKLVALSSQESLHWRQLRFCQLFLGNMVRRRFTEDGVKVFVKQLLDDRLQTRALAMNALILWLRANRPKTAKTTLELPSQNPVRVASANFPIPYGLLKDNQFLIYSGEQKPRDEDEWDATTLVNKNYIGFYQWPKEIKIDACASSQVEANRSKDEMKLVEKFLLNTFLDEEFLKKFVSLQLSQKRDRKSFSITTCRFFYYLFRNYNTVLLETFLKLFESLIQSKDVAQGRLAPEIFAGMVRGSKLWTFDKLQILWKRMETVLPSALENLSPEVFMNWATACEIIFMRADLRRYSWFIEMLLAWCEKPMTHVNQAEIRYSLISAAASNGDWRATDIQNRMLCIARPLMYTPYIIVRSQITPLFLDALNLDIPGFATDFKEIKSRFHPITMAVVIRAFSNDLRVLWSEAMSIDDTFKNLIPEPDKTLPERKGCINLFKALVLIINAFYSSGYQPLDPSVILCLPLLAHFVHEGDADLTRYCSTALKSRFPEAFVIDERADFIITVCEKAFQYCRVWKTKVPILTFLERVVFENLFVFETCDRRSRIMKLIQISIVDPQLDLRQTAAECLQSFVHCGFIAVTEELLGHYLSLAQLTKKKNFDKKHGGVLGLGSILQAFPYTVPKFLPQIIMYLCTFVTLKRKNVIKESMMHALREFRRTHQDNWEEHSRCFTPQQLRTLNNALVSPNYYV